MKILSFTNTIPENIFHLYEGLSKKKYPERVLTQAGRKLVNLWVKDVIWIEADGDYTKVHTSKQFYLSGKHMSDWEKILDPDIFQRIHRSAIISVSSIYEIIKGPGSLQVVLNIGHSLKVGRSYIKKVRKLII